MCIRDRSVNALNTRGNYLYLYHVLQESGEVVLLVDKHLNIVARVGVLGDRSYRERRREVSHNDTIKYTNLVTGHWFGFSSLGDPVSAEGN